jgi:hypothetical protein
MGQRLRRYQPIYKDHTDIINSNTLRLKIKYSRGCTDAAGGSLHMDPAGLRLP